MILKSKTLRFCIFTLCSLSFFSACVKSSIEVYDMDDPIQVQSKSTHYAYTYTTENVNLLDVAKDKNITIDKEEDVFIQVVFKTNLYVPSSIEDANEMNSFIEKNTEKLDGVLIHYKNSVPVRTIKVDNGIATLIECNNPHDGHCDDDYPLMNECSYDGIQDCVQHAVYEEWSTYTAINCAFTGGLACLLDEAASCYEENCL